MRVGDKIYERTLEKHKYSLKVNNNNKKIKQKVKISQKYVDYLIIII